MPDTVPPADLDLRLLRYFVALAEHGTFAAAAEALHLTQPTLSRQIRRLEQQLGARLLDRSPNGSRLTTAGEALLPGARTLLCVAASTAALTRAAAEPARVTVGYTTNIVVTPAVRELRRRHPDAEVDTAHLPWREVRPALLDRRVDAVVTRLPLRAEKLRVTVLYDEPRVLLLPVDHRLAGRESVVLADFADEPMIRASDPDRDAFWRVDPRPDGSRAPDGPLVEDLEDKLELIASGRAVAVVPAPGGLTRPYLTSVPVRDIEPSRVVLAARADDRSRLVTAFRTLALSLLTGPVPAGPAQTGPAQVRPAPNGS
ncbi:LysR family transcriptional regulator [Actinacidiphila yeochonensis]|uniref:LysR family transcriptional regulator n=1 Tax=Actinacidiphila yeochonensis TaxID=89050 RepID=UPI000564B084|nr:LysR family transcriptional regulator [Actinacidiphila yeochonensis]